MRRHVLIQLILLICYYTNLNTGKTAEILKNTYQQIGKNLIQVRKEHPQLQPQIYTILDQIGTMYRVSMRADQKKYEARRLVEEEKKINFHLKKDLDKIKNENLVLRTSLEKEHKTFEQVKNQLIEEKEKKSERSQKSAEQEQPEELSEA